MLTISRTAVRLGWTVCVLLSVSFAAFARLLAEEMLSCSSAAMCVALLCVHTAAGESVKIRSGRPANDAVERFVDALTIERLSCI